MTEEKPAVEVQEPPAQAELAQTKTPTQMELEKIHQEAEEVAYKKLQRAQTRLANENTALKKQLNQLTGRDKITRELIAEVKPEALPEWDKENQYAQWQQEVENRRNKMQEQIVTAGFNPDDEQFEGVFDLFETAALSGRFERAEEKLKRTLGKLKPATPKSKEEQEKELEKLIDERARKMLEGSGQLVTETSVPSGANRTWSMSEINKIAERVDGWRILEKEFGKNFAFEIDQRAKDGRIK